MWPPSKFAVSLWVNGADPDRHFTTSSPSEVWGAFQTQTQYPALLEVATTLHLEDETRIAQADLLVWINGKGQASVRLLDPIDYRPIDDSRALLAGEMPDFPEPIGPPFSVPAAEVITVEQAAEVLRYWLSCGGQWPGLTWIAR